MEILLIIYLIPIIVLITTYIYNKKFLSINIQKIALSIIFILFMPFPVIYIYFIIGIIPLIFIIQYIFTDVLFFCIFIIHLIAVYLIICVFYWIINKIGKNETEKWTLILIFSIFLMIASFAPIYVVSRGSNNPVNIINLFYILEILK